jgi:hypothetical protein
LVAPTVATAVLLLAHVPPAGVSDKVVVVPTQKFVLPLIGAGNGLTVIPAVAMQPVGSA